MDSLKIEGRAKTFYYVASVTAAYRKALDQYLADPLNDNFELSDDVLAELTRTSHRHYSPASTLARSRPVRQPTALLISVSGSLWALWKAGRMVLPPASSAANGALGIRWRCSARMAAASRCTRSGSKTRQGRRGIHPHAMEKYTIPTPELPP